MRRRNVLAALILGLVLTEGRVPISADESQLEPVRTLSPAGYDACCVRVAVDAAGNRTFVWGIGRNVPRPQWGVQTRTLSAAGVLGPVQTVFPPDTGSHSGQPSVALDQSGNAIIAWLRYRHDADGVPRHRVLLRVRFTDGTLSRTEVVAESTAGQGTVGEVDVGGFKRGPLLAVNAANDAVIGWTRSLDFRDFAIEVRIRTAPGVFTDIRAVAWNSGYRTIDPHLATDGAGNTRFVWASVGLDRILSRVLTTNGTLDAVQRVAASGYAAQPKVGIDAAGDALFAWTGGAERTLDVPHYVRSRVRSSDGGLSSTQRLSPSPSTGHGANSPSLAVAANGAAAVVFGFRDVWRGPTRVFGRVRSASGVWGEVEALSAETQLAELAQVGIDHAGNVVYAWQRDGYLEARARSASGALGPIQRIAGNAQLQHLVVDHAGTAVFAWRRYDGKNVRAQTRAWSGP